MRQHYLSGAIWEELVGYSRAVKVGDKIYISGTVATNAHGELEGGDSAYAQTKFIIEKLEKVLYTFGAELKHVIRTRLFVTDISKWQEYGKAHGEFFKTIKPCTTMVEVRQLIDASYLIEIEMEAIVDE